MIAITRDSIDAGRMIEQAKRPNTGGIVTFIGTVRDDGIDALELEVHEDVARSDLEQIAEEAKARFHLTSVDIIHRVGRLELTETILVIVAAAAHRQEAFEGCSYILERIKESVPIWKKDIKGDQPSWHFT